MIDDVLKDITLNDNNSENNVTKKIQILLRRKDNEAWEQSTLVIPEGEPCFSYDSDTGDYVLKIGAKDAYGNLQTWNALPMLRSRVDDGELI